MSPQNQYRQPTQGRSISQRAGRYMRNAAATVLLAAGALAVPSGRRRDPRDPHPDDSPAYGGSTPMVAHVKTHVPHEHQLTTPTQVPHEHQLSFDFSHENRGDIPAEHELAQAYQNFIEAPAVCAAIYGNRGNNSDRDVSPLLIVNVGSGGNDFIPGREIRFGWVSGYVRPLVGGLSKFPNPRDYGDTPSYKAALQKRFNAVYPEFQAILAQKAGTFNPFLYARGEGTSEIQDDLVEDIAIEALTHPSVTGGQVVRIADKVKPIQGYTGNIDSVGIAIEGAFNILVAQLAPGMSTQVQLQGLQHLATNGCPIDLRASFDELAAQFNATNLCKLQIEETVTRKDVRTAFENSVRPGVEELV
ncbi:MAG: hypothetical protein QF632_00590 [Candidatus Woesearchaeota archaeon]|nr:hypothetical protein [Candidatus Woesearchaeota archaeon]